MRVSLPPFAVSFARVVAGLRGVLAARMARVDATHPVLLLLWSRLGRLNNRIATLAARFAQGRSVTPRPRQSTPRKPNPRPATGPRLRLPSHPGWLVAHAIETAPYAAYFRQLLQDPQMAALIEAAPPLKRHLRPILRLLMQDLPEPLALPPRPPRPPRIRPPRPPRPRKAKRAPCHGARRPKEFWRPGPIRPLWTA
jgi:hypothetical protein